MRCNARKSRKWASRRRRKQTSDASRRALLAKRCNYFGGAPRNPAGARARRSGGRSGEPGNGRLDEQRTRRGRGTKEHAGAIARHDASRKARRAACCFGGEKRNPVTVADANSDDRSQAWRNSNAEEFAETDRKADPETDAEEKRRAEAHEAIC